MVNSKRKGAVGEREFANLCKDHGFDVRRTAQYNGKELDSKADVIGLEGIHAEVKRVERLNVENAIEQAVRDCKEGLPTVFHRKNGKEWLVSMRFEDWIKLYDKWIH